MEPSGESPKEADAEHQVVDDLKHLEVDERQLKAPIAHVEKQLSRACS
ncbi:hypothetical protein OZX74_03790 [Bifidobacterium sp. ESL0798]|nr:hypothetical protein [Bifidobacterium sp. ESL0798]WEV74649.1 hypothetical protein OZX74_03790 [Bifidobacterium sp. ESL0798]